MSTATKLTYDDYALIPDDGLRHEIIDGEHYVNPAPYLRHQRVSIKLTKILDTWVEAHALGSVYCAPADVVFARYTVVQPDIFFVSHERESILTPKNVQGAPDLIVEILSDSTRRDDEVRKRRLYEREGVREYWIVDLENDSVRIFRGGVETKVEEKITSPLFPGLEILLADVFAD